MRSTDVATLAHKTRAHGTYLCLVGCCKIDIISINEMECSRRNSRRRRRS